MELEPISFVREYFSLLEEYEKKGTENKRIISKVKTQTKAVLEHREVFNAYFETNIQDRIKFYSKINEALSFAIEKADTQLVQVLGETIKQVKKQQLLWMEESYEIIKKIQQWWT